MDKLARNGHFIAVNAYRAINTFLFGATLLLPFPLHAANTAQTVPVTVEPVKESTFSSIVTEVGKIDAIDSADLTFHASEKITAINFNDGDKVKKGDLIAELNNAKARAELDKSKSALELAKTKFERIQSLLKKEPNALSKQLVDESKENVDLAAAEYRLKKAIMKDYLIVAPFDGQLTSFSQSVGSLISSGTLLVTIFTLNPVEVQYSISQNDFGKAKKDQVVKVTVDSYKDRVFKGHVTYVAPAIDESSGRVEIRAELENTGYELAPGMFAKIKQYFNLKNKRLLVPQNSVIANNEERYVWLALDSKAIKQTITLGKNTNNGYVVVASGLEKKDLVIKTGMQNLNEDSTIKIVTPDSEKESSASPDAQSNSEKS